MELFATPARCLRARAGRTDLVERRRTLVIPLILPFHRRFYLPSPLNRRGRSLFSEVLADYLVTWLVAVMPAAQRMLLFHPAGIPVS